MVECSIVKRHVGRRGLQLARERAGSPISCTGNLTLNGLVTLELSKIGGTGWSQANKLTLVSYSGSWNGGLLSISGQAVADDAQFAFDGQTWVLNYNDTAKGNNFTSDATGGTYVTMTAVPEPGVALLGGLGLLALLRRRRE